MSHAEFLKISGACLCLLAFAACGRNETDVGELREQARIVDGVASERHLSKKIDYERDTRQLDAFAQLFAGLEVEMDRLRETVKLEERGYYTSDEHDAVASLLYRYLVAREAIWDLIALHGAYSKDGDEAARSKSTLIALHAASLLRDVSATMVARFYANEEVVGKLNEANHELGVSSGTFQSIFLQLTSGDSIAAVDEAFEMFTAARQEDGTAMANLIASDEMWERLAEGIPLYYSSSKKKIDAILRTSAIGLPRTRNAVRHSSVARSVSERLDELMADLYATRGKISNTFTGLKSPLSGLAIFEPEDVSTIKSYLKPGDILLTYTEGYMSNVFLPGLFKHGITYVGTPEERAELGLEKVDISFLPGARQESYRRFIEVRKTDEGFEPDLIEAVAEGVIFNSLEHVLATHTNRLLILRPRVSESEAREQLARVFLLLGDDYDFNFDFTNASRHCCTEVIYRSLHGKGSIRFDLVSRMGLQTLSADDIIGGFMEAPGEGFDFVLYVEEEGGGSRRAKVLAGKEGFGVFEERWRAK